VKLGSIRRALTAIAAGPQSEHCPILASPGSSRDLKVDALTLRIGSSGAAGQCRRLRHIGPGVRLRCS
jgi:hypothetical protein